MQKPMRILMQIQQLEVPDVMRCLRALALVALFGGIAACERVVSVTVPASTPRLVVEARLERVRDAVTGVQRIRLSTTDSYFNSTAPPPVRGATVRVTDDSGRVVVFTESLTDAGVYATNFLVINVRRAYTLRITYAGQEYVSTESTMSGVSIDSIFFAPGNGFRGPADGLRATIALQDPPGVRNFYLWDQFVNGVRLVSPDSESYSRVVASDEFNEGEYVPEFQPYDGRVVTSGQLVQIRQVSISPQAYRFYTALSEQSLNDGSPFGVPASSLRGNIANLTSPANVALGYFIVAEVTQAERRVP